MIENSLAKDQLWNSSGGLYMMLSYRAYLDIAWVLEGSQGRIIEILARAPVKQR